MRAGKKPKTNNGGGNMQQQLKQVQAMQKEMEVVQASLNEKEIKTTSGGGAVEVTVNGLKEVTKINIDPDVVDPEDVEMLQDLIVAAVKDAMRNASELASQQMSKVTGGMNIPGMPGF